MSGGHGPERRALGARRLDGGRDDVAVLGPNRPPSPACGFSPATAMRGSVDPELARQPSANWITLQLALGLARGGSLPQRHVGADVHDAQLAGDEQHRLVAHAGPLGQQLRVPGVLEPRDVHGPPCSAAPWPRRGTWSANASSTARSQDSERALRRRARRPTPNGRSSGKSVTGSTSITPGSKRGVGRPPRPGGSRARAPSRRTDARRIMATSPTTSELAGAPSFGEDLGDDLGPDPCRVAHGDRDHAFGAHARVLPPAASAAVALRRASGEPKPPALVTMRNGCGSDQAAEDDARLELVLDEQAGGAEPARHARGGVAAGEHEARDCAGARRSRGGLREGRRDRAWIAGAVLRDAARTRAGAVAARRSPASEYVALRRAASATAGAQTRAICSRVVALALPTTTSTRPPGPSSSGSSTPGPG